MYKQIINLLLQNKVNFQLVVSSLEVAKSYFDEKDLQTIELSAFHNLITNEKTVEDIFSDNYNKDKITLFYIDPSVESGLINYNDNPSKSIYNIIRKVNTLTTNSIIFAIIRGQLEEYTFKDMDFMTVGSLIVTNK